MKKKFGQNFLINKNIVYDIIKEANINKNSIIYEIGPGNGVLTEHIVKSNPEKFIAIEIDCSLKDKLDKYFFDKRYELIFGDALKFNEINFFKNKVTIISNLPYNISVKLLIKWIFIQAEFGLFKEMILMFQKEVAERIVAKVNTKKYGRITLLTTAIFDVIKFKDVSKDNFFPRPKVDSIVLKFTPHKKTHLNKNELFNLEKISMKLFSNRRKKIKKNLLTLLNNEYIDTSKYSKLFNLRPENINREDYFALAKLIK